MAETKRDPYEILGIDKNATQDDIKHAYRTLAKKYHPDINKEPGAEEKFKEIQGAYEILSDPDKKAKYDQFGYAAFDGSMGGGFQGGIHLKDSEDLKISLNHSLEEVDVAARVHLAQ